VVAKVEIAKAEIAKAELAERVGACHPAHQLLNEASRQNTAGTQLTTAATNRITAATQRITAAAFVRKSIMRYGPHFFSASIRREKQVMVRSLRRN
jgi:hypothetical protein